MLRKSILSFMLSFGMLVSPLAGLNVSAAPDSEMDGGSQNGAENVPENALSGEAEGAGDEVQTGETDASADEVQTGETDASADEVQTGETDASADEVQTGEADALADEAQSGEVETFSDESIGSWGMTGDAASGVTIADDSVNEGNKYLRFYKREGHNTVTTKSFGELPRMGSAHIAFKWYFGGMVSTNRAGFTGIKLTDGDNEVLTLYINEMRNEGDEASLFYSVGGGLDARVDSGVKVANGSWYDFDISIDYAAHTLTVKMNGEEVISGVQFFEITNKVDAFSFVTFDTDGGTKVTPTMGIDDFYFAYEEPAAETGSVSTDFQNEDAENWGMTGDLASDFVIIEDDTVGAAEGNKYLKITRKDRRNTVTVKNFANMPRMSGATVDFKWYFGGMVSTNRAGFAGVKLMDGDNEVLALYINEMRNAGDEASLFYSTAGLDARQDTGAKVANGNWYDVSIELDFSAHTATVNLGGGQVASAEILEIAHKVDGFAFVTFDPDGGTKVTPTMGFDDFAINYTAAGDGPVDSTIYSLDAIENIIVSQEEWQAGYTHPDKVSALLTDGNRVEVAIDSTSWMSAPAFDPNVKGMYTWTADIIAPADHANVKGLKASYIMEYTVPADTDHYYWNDFTFAGEIWESVAWGKSMDSSSGTGYFNLTHETDEQGNNYMKAEVTGNGDRGSRLDLSTQIVTGSKVSFDWMPISTNGKANGQIMFLSTDSWHPYFVLRFDKETYAIKAYTENPLGNCSTSQNPFEGSISVENAIDTGLSGNNKWYTVSMEFNYLSHTADLTIAEKDDPTKTFTQTGIPIETEANGLKSMVIHMNRLEAGASVAMGVDNIAVDYINFTAGDIVSVTNPANVNVTKTEYDEFQFPTTATVGLGDGTTTTIPLGSWSAEPAFNPDASGYYVWTAPLAADGLNNVFGFDVSFTMTYTVYPFPTYVYNPNALELDFGQALPTEFPTEVTAHMSDGTIGKVKVGEWTAIREFNAAEEGIYVYGANVVETEGEYEVVRDQLRKNENPEDPSAQRVDYVYDVYYRISYFEDEDNYNAYTRTMEYLDRGVYAVEQEGGVFVSWRLLASEYGKNIAFNVLRNGEKVNGDPITTKTNFVDAAGKAGDTYVIETVQNGKSTKSSEAVAGDKNYMSIPLQKPDPQPTKDGVLSAYTINDAGTADVDGDGEYEIIVKWYPDNAFDSGQAVAPSSPTIFDIYEMDGTPLWRLNLGLEMPSGAHFNQFMLYDLDEDGKAELFIKTSDGAVTYRPNADGKFDMTDESTIISYIGDKSVVPGTNVNSNGHVNSNTNEYVSVFNGQTGEEIDTIDYINVTGDFDDWGKPGDGGNRSARYNIAIAYLPRNPGDAGCTETIPAVLFNRGYYAKTTVAAYTLRDGKINLEWNYATESGTNEAGKGNHNMSTGDLDKDGFDELVIGAMAIDHDGSVLWVKDGEDGRDYAGHGDTIHLSAMNPYTDDLYVFGPQEDTKATTNDSMTNAGTGARIAGVWFTTKDVGRAVAANITPLPGFEYWSAASGSGIYNFFGEIVNTAKPVSSNWVLYWDGDLLNELGDGAGTEGNMVISKYDWENETVNVLAQFEGTKLNNYTKNTPSLTADLFGDWREEVVVRNEDNTELRIYMTTEETDYMIYTLMHDPVYRNAVANQNTSYNQPPHLGFYLGEDVADQVLAMQLPTAKIKYAGVDVESGNEWVEEDGSLYWYEDGVKQGTEGRGKEIYDPASDAWCWLEAEDNGRMAKDKDVYVESNGGKWVRYDANGHMVKGWNEKNGSQYYFDEITGAMAKGTVNIEGEVYYFDEMTGILQETGVVREGLYTIDGVEYWYEGGVRQGYEPYNPFYRGKEVYDSKADAWYWLDNAQNGAKVTNKDVYVETEDGAGKWTRYDENGCRVKGWQMTDAGTYYFDEATGAMAKGEVTIEGKNYTFDTVSGIMQ